MAPEISNFVDVLDDLNLSPVNRQKVYDALLDIVRPPTKEEQQTAAFVNDMTDDFGDEAFADVLAKANLFVAELTDGIAFTRRKIKNNRHKIPKNKMAAAHKVLNGLIMQENILGLLNHVDYAPALADGLKNQSLLRGIIAKRTGCGFENADVISKFICKGFKDPDAYRIVNTKSKDGQSLLRGYFTSPWNVGINTFHPVMKALHGVGILVSQVFGSFQLLGCPHDNYNICFKLDADHVADVVEERLETLKRIRLEKFPRPLQNDASFNDKFNWLMTQQLFEPSLMASLGSAKHELNFYQMMATALNCSLDHMFAPEDCSVLDQYVDPNAAEFIETEL